MKQEPEVEIAPIMGRKKKQKKEKPFKSAVGGSTPVVSRPPSPVAEVPAEPEAVEQPRQVIAEQPSVGEKDSNKPASKVQDAKGKGKAKVEPIPTPELVSTSGELEEEIGEKPVPNPGAVFQNLISAGLITDPSGLNVLKVPLGLNHRHELTVDIHNADQKLTITPEDRAALLNGKPVHKIAEGLSRIMLTPNGDCVRNLTAEEEDRYLELQTRIAKEAGPAAFISTKHQAGHGFTLIGGRAVPNGPPAFFPLHSNSTPIDPVSKIQRGEALAYINQFVLPSLSLSANSQIEKALNANALDAEMLRSESSTWPSWGSGAASARNDNEESSYSTTSQEGILATGLESITSHFAVGREIERGQPLGNVSMLNLADSESAMQMARKETETLEKKLNQLLKKNKRLLLGSGH